ncbi:MAG: FHA domain-containing protein [Planctomycetota bacterium]
MLVLMLLKSRGKGVRFEVSGRVPVFIGRHALGLDAIDSKMSRQHAEIWFERGVWLLRDLNSTNGTFVNGKRALGLVELEIGDRIRCGRSELVVADLQPVERVEGQGWGSDPDDTAMAAGELSGLLDAAQREGGSASGLVRLSNSDAEDQAEAPASPVEPKETSRGGSDASAAPRPEAREAGDQQSDDPHADLISLIDTEGVAEKVRPASPPDATEPKTFEPATPEPRAVDGATADLNQAASAPDGLQDDPPDQVFAPDESPAEHDSHADEYTGDAVVDLPPIESAAGSASPPAASRPTAEPVEASSPEVSDDDSPAEPATPDNDVAAVAASDTPEAPPASETPTPIQAPAASAGPDGSEPSGAPVADEPVASETPSLDASDQDDDDMLTLGFKGREEPSREIEIDEPGLRGETPGRFIVEDHDESGAPTGLVEPMDADPAAIGADDDPSASPQPGDSPWASGERAALLGPPLDHDRDTDERTSTDDDQTPGHAGGRGRQRLPMALVGTLVVLFAGGAWFFGALRQGWIQPPAVTGTEAAPDAPVVETPLPAVDQLADARRPRSNSVARRHAENRVSRPAPDATPALPRDATPPSSATADSRSSSELDAFGSGLALPPAPAPAADNANTTGDAPLASAVEPRVGSAAQLQAIIEHADAQRAAEDALADAASAEPQRPLAVDNPSESFVWSGLTIGNEDTVFKAQTQPSATADSGTAPPEAAGAESAEATPPGGAPPIVSQPTVVAIATPDAPQAAPVENLADPAVLNAPRRVAFLVDISGTMVDSMPQLRAHLADAIDRLEPDTAFTILLFRQGQAVELPPTGLRLASASARSQAIRWLDGDLRQGAGAIQLGGRSDPTRALRTALSYDATDLVILSDNALGKRAKPNGGDLGLVDLMDALDGRPNLRLHAVQFNYADERQLLRQLTDRFEGNYEFVEEVLDASPDGIQPLTLIDALR